VKVSRVDVTPVSLSLPEPAFDATARWDRFNFLMVNVETSDGLVGVSDIAPLHEKEAPIYESIIKKKLEGLVVGEEPYDLERLWLKMVGKGSGAYALGSKGAILSAVSAIDIALWDIVSKSFGTPLYNLLGGKFRDRVKLYVSFMGDIPIDRIKYFLDQGFKAVKIKLGFDLEKDVNKIIEIREALGYGFDLMVDINQGYDLRQAIAFTSKAEKYEVYWVEEPINVYNFKALKILSEKTRIPIGLGENYYGKDEFFNVLEGDIAGVIQPDVNHAGGLTPIRKIVSLASFLDTPVAPHLHSIIGFAVGLHILTSVPNGLIAEYVIYGKRWKERDEALKSLVSVDDGYAKLRCKEGIGVEPDKLLEVFKESPV